MLFPRILLLDRAMDGSMDQRLLSFVTPGSDPGDFMVVFDWDQPFQPKLHLVETVFLTVTGEKTFSTVFG